MVVSFAKKYIVWNNFIKFLSQKIIQVGVYSLINKQIQVTIKYFLIIFKS